MAAAIDGNAKIIQILLNYGADMTAQEFLKRTAFQHSIEHNNTHAIHCFLNLMSKEELETFSKESEENRILVEGFNEALLKNAYILRQNFRKKINIPDAKKNHFGVFEGFPEIIAHIQRCPSILRCA